MSNNLQRKSDNELQIRALFHFFQSELDVK